MATIAPTTAGQLEIVEPGEAHTKTCAVDLVGATFVTEDASGNWVQALADTAGHAAGARLLINSAKAGVAATAFRTGVFGGLTITQAFGSAVYLSNTGTLADAAGSSSYVVARVTSGTGNLVTAAHEKLIALNCPI
jgi:hypothetical protein